VLLAAPASRELITLYTERDGNAARVVAVLRQVIVPKDNDVTAAIVADAVKKYGEPDARTDRGIFWGRKPRASDGYFSSCVGINGVGNWGNHSPWQPPQGTSTTIDRPTAEFLGSLLGMRVDVLESHVKQQDRGNRRLADCPPETGLTFIQRADSTIVGQWTIDTPGTAELLDRIRATAATPAPETGAPKSDPRQQAPAAPKIKL
jgi:hypothetical protein